MPAKTGKNSLYKSLQGKLVDIDMLRQKNELTPAIGNMRVNARGDQIGKGGKIVRSRESLLKDYYASQDGMPTEKMVERPKLNQEQDEQVVVVEEKAPQPAVETKPATNTRNKKKDEPKVIDGPTKEELEEWEETPDGDFVKKEK